MNDEGYFFEVDVQYPKKLYEFHMDLPFLSERMELGKIKKLVTSLHDKNEYVIHIINLKQALNHRFILKNVHGVTKFYQNVWLEPYIKMNTDLIKIAKNDFGKNFFKLMNNTIWEDYGNVRKNIETLNL